MWMFLLLYSVYFAVISANELCPDGCECQLTIIKCVGQKLLQIPKVIPKDVTNLDLSGNRLSWFGNKTFLEFSNLIELNLTDNEIKDVASLGAFPKSLRILHLNGNKLKSLSGNWMQFTKLDFSRNRIETIANKTFMGVRYLTELTLSDNQIRSIPPTALKDLPSLQRLKLDGNNLTEFPEIKWPSLQTLDLSGNQLNTIKSFTLFKIIPSIEVLKLSNNKIKVLQVAAFSTLKLRRLYLDGNLLESVTNEWMFGMMTLEYLRLDRNKIANISASSWKANCCKKLKYINLAHNKLKRILFDSNKNYDANFMNLDTLDTLNLGSNKILDISNGAFKDLKKLRILDLSNNRISLVENSTFNKLPSLEKLDMRNNPIMEVTKDAFTSLENLKDLTKRFSRSIGFKCNQPKKLSGIDFTKIPLKDLVCDSSRPEIIGHPESQIAMTGDEVRLSCTVKNGSIEGLRILWQKNMNNVDMTESSKVIIYTQKQDKFEIYKSILFLNHVTDAKDSGAYQCFVLAGKERIPSRIARLRVFVYPKFTRTPGDLVTNIGDDVHFNCSASGHPVPEISFRKENVLRHQAVEEGRIGLEGTTFIIRNVSRIDVGLYRCIAKSEAGVINTTFTLNVIGKPVAVHKMFDKVTLVNDAAIFVCAASAWPRPKFTWFKDGKILDLTSTNLQLRNERDAQHLVILHAGYSNAGRYKCRVSNVLGFVALSSQLRVVKDLSEKSTSLGDESVSDKTLIGAVVFTAACTMVVTALICVAVLHVITHRGCACLTRHKTSGTVTLDSYAATDPENEQYIQMTETFSSESPRSSSTFVTSSDSQGHSDLQTSSSESGSSKEHRDGSYDGRHSSGVCSMNSSNSSLASTTNHRNTFPFSNTKTYPYPGTGEELYDVSSASNDVSSTRGHPTPRESLQIRINEQYFPGRRKHRLSRDKLSRSRERHVNKRRKGAEQERLHINEPPEQNSATDEYRTESVTESEGTVL